MILTGRFLLVLACTLCCIQSFSQLDDAAIHDLKGGNISSDTSYVYCLPYEAGKSHLLIQGANSRLSHRHELSLDFKMKVGCKILAARDGIVIEAKSDSKRGGLKHENYSDGNFIIIKHGDGSTAYYWHLTYNGVKVNVGEIVKKGQFIGLSGNTGYTAFPHLHFQVTDRDGRQTLARFQTKHGVRYLRPGNWYRSIQLQ